MFLFSAVMGVIGAIVGAISPNYSTLVAARILQGLSSSAFESIIVTVIGYFLK
jgi:predicted MFS family arabinose efflux permease